MVGPPKLYPDNVMIAGSRNLVNDIKHVLIGPDSLIDVKSDVELTLSLVSPKDQLIEYNQKK